VWLEHHMMHAPTAVSVECHSERYDSGASSASRSKNTFTARENLYSVKHLTRERH
jgi:hypothetical protein